MCNIARKKHFRFVVGFPFLLGGGISERSHDRSVFG
jgi:hypothetical protein